MKLVVAVSGGIDSVVLLDMLTKEKKHELVVCHFDHGIRPESDWDARFCWSLAKKYDLPFEVRREELGKNASEAMARARRYKFLSNVAKKYQAMIVTAHHADDLAGSVAINLIRGTGWRGLAALGREDIVRPLLSYRKRDIYHYALQHGLEWVEDDTNRDTKILRNRLRPAIHELDDTTIETLANLRDEQVGLARKIDAESAKIITSIGSDRHFYQMIDQRPGIELLREYILEVTGRRPLCADAERLLHAIKVAKTGTRLQLADGIVVIFSAREFIATGPPLVVQ